MEKPRTGSLSVLSGGTFSSLRNAGAILSEVVHTAGRECTDNMFLRYYYSTNAYAMQ